MGTGGWWQQGMMILQETLTNHKAWMVSLQEK